MELFAKKIEKQLASYQQELIETHYREVGQYVPPDPRLAA